MTPDVEAAVGHLRQALRALAVRPPDVPGLIVPLGTLDEMKVSIARQVLHLEGTRAAAAVKLGVSRHTLNAILRLKEPAGENRTDAKEGGEHAKS